MTMGILSGPEILRQVQIGSIVIDPFDPDRVGPNSVDLCLGDTLLVIEDSELDLAAPIRRTRRVQIPPGGIYLQPGCGVLAHTVERIAAHGFVPWVDGRSTLGRYFVLAHHTAGRGDDGFDGTFTMELLATCKPVKVYAGMPMFQATFFTLDGARRPYAGRYRGQVGPQLPKPLPRPQQRK